MSFAGFMQPVPAGMTPAAAASCATIYATAYVALMDVARIQSGESVLIHAGAGGLGQAAIQLARMVGAEIFVTVGSVAKKNLIMEKYSIAEDHIFNSRDVTFAKGEGILRVFDVTKTDTSYRCHAADGPAWCRCHPQLDFWRSASPDLALYCALWPVPRGRQA